MNYCLAIMSSVLVASTFTVWAMPEACVQHPDRTQECPNLLFKRAPVDVAVTDVKKGEIVCICMSDFRDLRIQAQDDFSRINQQAALARAASSMGMSESDLLALIRD